nr:MAG TPA: hypothetical protein [Bacteriophage sp.]
MSTSSDIIIIVQKISTLHCLQQKAVRKQSLEI